MASSPITSWEVEGENVEVVTDFGGPKITADGDCSHEIRRLLLLGKKAMTNLNSVLKSRDITLLTKVYTVKAVVFPVVMYGFESWSQGRQKAKELMPSNCGAGEDSWKSLGLSNQSILREINSEYSLERLMLMLKLKLQYFGHLMQADNSLEKSLMMEKIAGRRRRGCEWMRWLDGIPDAMNMNSGKLQEMVRDREALRAAAHGVAKSRIWLADWTTTTIILRVWIPPLHVCIWDIWHVS